MTELNAFQIKEMKKADIMAIPGVVGIGVGSGSGPRINVYVEMITPELLHEIPKVMNGMETNVIQSGTIKALFGSEIPRALIAEREKRIRPAPCGVSVGNLSISAGTLGCLIRDNFTGKRVILSNAHVLTPNGSLPTADEKRIVQPGVHDNGGINDVIAQLTRYIQISTNNLNKVDAAIATPISDNDVSDEILDIGQISGVGTVTLGTAAQKSGRTSGLTMGSVIDISADIRVHYKEFVADFTDVFVTEAMAEPGDSGSATLDMDNKLLGLTFAGSDFVTSHIKIQNIMDELNVSVGGGIVPPSPVQFSGIAIGLLALGIGAAYLLGWGK